MYVYDYTENYVACYNLNHQVNKPVVEILKRKVGNVYRNVHQAFTGGATLPCAVPHSKFKFYE